jgi:KDO2-lipid IV(A) lauroyltransferase
MLSYLGYRILDLAVGLLPAAGADGLAVRLSHVWFAAHPRARRVLERNLARVRPDQSHEERRALARRSFEQFALSLVEFARLARLGPERLVRAIEVRGAHHLANASAGGRGVIVLSAHLGNWEWGAAFLAAIGRPVHVVARAHPSRWVEALFQRRRAERGVHVLPERPRWAHAAQALRRGECVALMVDRSGDSIGRRAAASRPCAWAAALSRRTGAALLPAVVIRTGPGRFAACFAPPLDAEAVACGGHRAALRGFLSRHSDQWSGFEPLPASFA